MEEPQRSDVETFVLDKGLFEVHKWVLSSIAKTYGEAVPSNARLREYATFVQAIQAALSDCTIGERIVSAALFIGMIFSNGAKEDVGPEELVN